MGARQIADDPTHLLFGQDRGHSLWSLGAKSINGTFQVLLEHLTVQEQQGVEGFVVSAAERPGSGLTRRRVAPQPNG